MVCGLQAGEAALMRDPIIFLITENLFDLFAKPLAQAMTRVPPDQAVQAGGAPVADSGDVGTNPVLTQTPDEVPAV